jgi:hypothetical protein
MKKQAHSKLRPVTKSARPITRGDVLSSNVANDAIISSEFQKLDFEESPTSAISQPVSKIANVIDEIPKPKTRKGSLISKANNQKSNPMDETAQKVTNFTLPAMRRKSSVKSNDNNYRRSNPFNKLKPPTKLAVLEEQHDHDSNIPEEKIEHYKLITPTGHSLVNNSKQHNEMHHKPITPKKAKRVAYAHSHLSTNNDAITNNRPIGLDMGEVADDVAIKKSEKVSRFGESDVKNIQSEQINENYPLSRDDKTFSKGSLRSILKQTKSNGDVTQDEKLKIVDSLLPNVDTVVTASEASVSECSVSDAHHCVVPASDAPVSDFNGANQGSQIDISVKRLSIVDAIRNSVSSLKQRNSITKVSSTEKAKDRNSTTSLKQRNSMAKSPKESTTENAKENIEVQV